MSSSYSWWLIAAPVLFLVILKTSFQRWNRKQRAPYPPGPKSLPIIGNMLDLKAVTDHGPEYAEWSKKYNSGIVFAHAFGTKVLIVNNLKDADELLDRRAGIYSDRPRIPMVDVMGWEGAVSLRTYGQGWRLCRKIAHQSFNYKFAQRHYPVAKEKVYNFLGALLETPEKAVNHYKLLSVSFALSIMCGYEVKSLEDEIIELAEHNVLQGTSVLTPDGSIVNFLPFLKHIPHWLAGPITSLKIAAEVKRNTSHMMTMMWDFAQNAVRHGTASRSLMTEFIEKERDCGASEQEKRAVADVAFTTYGGASETIISFTDNFFFLMTKHPEVQRKAQAEIDSITMSDRLPTFEDRPSLPYIEAIYREVLRFRQSLPLGVAHSSIEDDYYKGYFIPKGTMVLANMWAMTHDENIYPDPYSFKPERFFDENGKLNDDDRVLAFGFGRRICVGKEIASALTWLIIVSVLACYNIEKGKDSNGNEIEPNEEYAVGGLMVQKKPFSFSVVPRGDIYKELIAAKNQNIS